MPAKHAHVSRPWRRLIAAQVLGVYLAATLLPSSVYAAPTTPPASLAQVPQFLPMPLSPNLVITLDDSGSMRWAYMPDGMCSEHAARRVKSADYNPLYYDPRIRYEPPLRFNPSTGTYERLTTNFNAAYVNGFAPHLGTVDLSQDYRVTWSYDPASTGSTTTYGCSDARNRYAENPAADFYSAASGDRRQSPVEAYYYLYDPAVAGCVSPAITNDNCYRLVTVSSTSGPAVADINADGVIDAVDRDERQNFANWYSFYRTRNLLTVSSASLALAALPDSVRVAWQALTTCAAFGTGCAGWSGTTVDNRIRAFGTQHRANFYSWLLRLPAESNTPLREAMRRAGDYYRTSGVNSPYAQDPQVQVGTEFGCRPNFHLLMTDGLWNETTASFCSGTNCGNADGNGATLPDGVVFPSKDDTNHTAYALTRIYRDSNSDSLADVAFHYWRTDLRPDLPDNLVPYYADRNGTAAQQYWNPKNDPATWQHMVNFTVGLGLTSVMNVTNPVDIRWSGGTHQGQGYANLLSGAGSWPATKANESPGNVYDLWHAAINSRGLAFSAERPAELVDGFKRIVQEIMRARAVVGTAAASSVAYLDIGNAVFTAEFGRGSWAGNLYRREIDPSSLSFRATDASGNPRPRDSNDQPYVWRASDVLPLPNARRIFTMRTGSSARAPVVAFLPNDGDVGVDTAQMADLNSPLGAAADVIAYVRGDVSKESSAGGNFRDRPHLQPPAADNRRNVLGTIGNSSPMYVKDLDWGYDFLPASTSSAVTGRETYLAYLRANQGDASHPGRRGMVWTGSNSGMFHAFDAETGIERFAYVPRSVIRNLVSLVDPQYTHRYLVDGVPAQGDAHIATPVDGTVRWRTVVVSSLGAGGRAVFAIDATDPNALNETSVLWELDEQSLSASDYEKLGHVLGPAIVARVKDDTRPSGGRWVAVFGNGPESDEKTAALFVVDLETGSVVRVLDTRNGNASNPNGLSTPAPLFDANRQLIAVYAGDLRGNLWKFDLSGANPAAWSVAFNGNPLFTTRSPSNVGPAASRNRPQPIFAKPLLRLHPDGGVMVLFGTGKLISPGDRESEDVQTFYGIWDKPNESNGLSGNFRGSGGPLVQQALTAKSGEPLMYLMTDYDVNYAAGKRGWFFDLGVVYGTAGDATLVTPRERLIAAPVAFGQNLLAQTFVPSVDSCDLAGLSFLFRLNFLTGRFVGTGSFGTPQSAAIAMPGSFGLLPFVERLAQGGDPRNRTGVVFGIGLGGELSGRRMELGGFGAFRTWRQLLD